MNHWLLVSIGFLFPSLVLVTCAVMGSSVRAGLWMSFMRRLMRYCTPVTLPKEMQGAALAALWSLSYHMHSVVYSILTSHLLVTVWLVVCICSVCVYIHACNVCTVCVHLGMCLYVRTYMCTYVLCVYMFVSMGRWKHVSHTVCVLLLPKRHKLYTSYLLWRFEFEKLVLALSNTRESATKHVSEHLSHLPSSDVSTPSTPDHPLLSFGSVMLGCWASEMGKAVSVHTYIRTYVKCALWPDQRCCNVLSVAGWCASTSCT